MNTFDLTLDLSKRGPFQSVPIRQGDKSGTTIRATITDHGVAVSTSGLTSRFVMRLPDNEHYYRETATLSGSTATVTIDEAQAASAAGRTDTAYFQLLQGTDVIASTESFTVIVLPDALADATVPESYDSAIQEAIDALDAAENDIISLKNKFSIVAANAAAHNAIYRGKNITSMEKSGKLYVNIANGTFDDIYIGDYFTKSINGTNYTLRIAAFNYYYSMGDTAFTKPHAVIIPDSTFGSAQMNSSDVVTGGYIGTKMRTETLQTWLSYLKTAFGSHLLTPRCLYDNACDGSSYSDASRYDGSLELMTEEQVYGARQQGITSHTGWCYPGVDYAQFPLFALDHSRILRNTSGWWLRSVVSSTGFANVNHFGIATGARASTNLGVRPRFLIG